MLVATYDPTTGWSAPEIKPYGPLSLDPACSCFQYCPNVFEGMKVYIHDQSDEAALTFCSSQAYLGPDGKPRLFRPDLNMARLKRSAERVALPVRHESSMYGWLN